MESPSDVEDFVRYLADVDGVLSALPDLEARLQVVTNMYNVTQHFEVKVQEEEMALYKSLFPQFRHLKVC